MDTERSRRHASKVLTYPLTIGSVLHQHSNLTLSNQRLTPEGSRSLAGKSRAFLSIRCDANSLLQRFDLRCMFLPEHLIRRKLVLENLK